MSNDVKLEQAADEAARSALSEEWPDGYDHFEREIFKAGFLAGARYQSQQREGVVGLKRMWIDQPSTLQPLHSLHGTNVLAQPDTDKVMRVYFLSGDVISQQVPNEALSPGWRTASNPTLTGTHSTPAPAVKPHCSTCGKDVAEVLCETCGKWWADNPPPAPAVSRDELVRLHKSVSSRIDRLAAILSRLRGEGE